MQVHFILEECNMISGNRLLENRNASRYTNQISDSIFKLTAKVEKIESVTGRSLHTINLRNKIEMLEEQINYRGS